MSLQSLRDLLPDVPSWQWRFQRKYQLKTMLRMNEVLSESGLTQKDLAERAGWSKSYVSRLLSPGGNVTLRTLARFEDAVGADVLAVTSAPAPLSFVAQPVRERALMPSESVRVGSTLLRPSEFVSSGANDYSYTLDTNG